MQPIRHEPEYLKGLEILTFDLVELEKIRGGGAHTFATLGKLSVFYFDYFERFILQLNNWKYCLLPKLLTAEITNQSGLETRNFIMPAYDGIYTLKLGQNFNPNALQNFETILSNTTKFRSENHELLMQRQDGLKSVEVVQSQYVTNLGAPYEKPQEMLGYYSYGTNQLPSNVTGQKLKKKGTFSKIKEKFKRKPKNKRQANLNMTEFRDFASIKATPENMVNVVEFRREEVEDIISSTKDIVRKIEAPQLTKTEEVKEKVAGIVDAIKEGVHDIKERIAERHEHEAQTGEAIGIMQIIKEGIVEIRDKINHKGHLEDGEIEPPEDPHAPKPGIIETVKESVKHSVHDLKERAAHRNELEGKPVAEIGFMDMVKEGVLELKEKLSKKGHEETIATERVEATTYGSLPVAETIVSNETHLGNIIIHEPPQFYESHRTTEGRLKIFDDKYLDQPLGNKPFPLSGDAGQDMLLHYEEYVRESHNLERATVYKEDQSTLSLIDKIKLSLTPGKKTNYEAKETQMPDGHAPRNISGKIHDMFHPAKPGLPQDEPSTMDKAKAFLTGKPPPQSSLDKAHSPVKKREYIKAMIPMCFKGAGHEEEVEAGTLGNMMKAGGVIGIAQTQGLSGIADTMVPILLGQDQQKKAQVYEPEKCLQSISVPEVRNVQPLNEQRNLQNLQSQYQLGDRFVSVVQQTYQQHLSEVNPVNTTIPVQSRVVERRFERAVDPQSQISSNPNDSIYEVNIAHYQA